MRWVLGSVAMLLIAFPVSSVQAVIAVGPNSPPLAVGDPTLLDARGWAVDISGDRAVVGTGGGGEAFVFDVNSGELLTPLIPDPRFSRSLYGYSVAIDGDRVVVGSSNGRAYAYTLVPEPAAACLAALLAGGALVRRPRRR